MFSHAGEKNSTQQQDFWKFFQVFSPTKKWRLLTRAAAETGQNRTSRPHSGIYPTRAASSNDKQVPLLVTHKVCPLAPRRSSQRVARSAKFRCATPATCRREKPLNLHLAAPWLAEASDCTSRPRGGSETAGWGIMRTRRHKQCRRVIYY